MLQKILLTIIFALALQAAVAQVPGTISYQGLLTDNNGSPIEGTVSVTFKFYKGDTEVLDPTLSRTLSVTTYKGLFTVILGNGTPAENTPLPTSLGNQPCSIGITYLGTEFTPRVKLTSVPYAFVANTANNVDGAAINSGTISIARIADGTVTDAKLATGINASKLTTVPIANGGTAATTTAGARTSLGLTIGTNVQAYDADLDDLADGTLSSTIISLTGTGASKLATGTTAQRPSPAVEGQIRYNSEEKVMEYYNGTTWYFMTPKIAFLKEVFGSGVDGGNGGTLTGGSNFTTTSTVRALNTLEGDNVVVSSNISSNSVVSLNTSSNVFTLQAGEYVIEVVAPAYHIDRHKIRIFDPVSNVTYGVGSSEHSPFGGYTISSSTCYARISIFQGTNFVIQHIATTTFGPTSLGLPGSFSVNEIYTQVKITKLRGQ